MMTETETDKPRSPKTKTKTPAPGLRSGAPRLHTAAAWSRAAKKSRPADQTSLALSRLIKQSAAFTLTVTLQAKRPSLYQALHEQLQEQTAPEFSLDAHIVSDDEIHQMNRDFRGRDKATDVLSFPFWEGETPPFESDVLPLGDLIISIETAHRQSQELNHSLNAELAFLTVHGVLHLLGYDHDTPARRRKMFSWQDEVFEQFTAQILKVSA